MLELRANAVLLMLVVLSAGGCASTQIVNVWRDPAFSAPTKRIMIIGVTKQAGIRRTFEDEFARRLATQGVQAVQSYTLIPEDGEVPDERLAQAVKRAGVESVLISRLVRVEVHTQVYVGAYPGPPPFGFYGYYSWAWGSYYDPPQIYNYDVAVAETNLFDTSTDKLIWSGTTRTIALSDLNKEIREFVDVVVKALAESRVI